MIEFIPGKVYIISKSGNGDSISNRLLCRKRLKYCIIFQDKDDNILTFPFIVTNTFDKLSKMLKETKQEMCVSSENTRIFAESWIERNPDNFLQDII